MKFTLSQEEKLKSQKQIELLFAEGTSFVSFPLRVIFKEVDGNLKSQAAFSAPKKNFKQAVQRNRVKRQMREAYRLQKAILDQENGKKFVLLFVCIAKELPSYDLISSALGKLLTKITNYHS